MTSAQQFIKPMIACLALLVSISVTGQLPAQKGRSQQTAALEMLIRQMDINKNGYIDPSEMKGLAKKYAQRGGLAANRSHQINKVVEIVRNKGKTPANSKKSETNRKVPGFEIEPAESLGVMDFSPTGEERMTVDMMKRKFSASVMSQVERTMTRNDKDKSGFLDVKEIARSSWSNPSWPESDTNSDKKLSRLELAYRYKGREEAAKNKVNAKAVKLNSMSRGRSLSNASTSTRGRGARGGRASTTRGMTSGLTSTASSSSRRRGFNSGSDAYKRYAEGLLKSYDDNKDGRLSKEELKDMKRPPKNADKNRDGYVDKSELISSVEERSGGAKDNGSSANSSAEKLRRTVEDSKSTLNELDSIFGGKDMNNDRQLQMIEFSDEWDDELVSEFEEKDENGDGVITEAEWKRK